MYKIMVTFKINEGVDPDEFWKWYVDTRKDFFKDRPGLRRLVINRVTKVEEDPLKIDSPVPQFWACMEAWYNSPDDLKKAAKVPSNKKAGKELRSKISLMTTHVVDEEVIIGDDLFPL